MKSKVENNKLIAIFMELKIGIYPSIDGKRYWETPIGDVSMDSANLLLYNSSWDWLMPVIEKIEEIEEIEMTEIKYGDDEYGYVTEIYHCEIASIKSYGKTKLESVYYAIVAFITWHNKNI